MILSFLVNILTAPFLEGVQAIFNQHLAPIVVKLLILAFLAGFILLVGVLGRSFFSDYFFTHIDAVVHRIPIISTIYKAITEVVHTLFDDENTGFTSVVLAPYPSNQTMSIGFVTRESLPQETDPQYVNLVSVFVPAALNPSIGFMLFYPKEDLIYLDINKEDAIKLIVSCGVMLSDFKTMSPPPSDKNDQGTES